MSKTYTVKQVIFALREEYKKVEKQLEDLKQYVSISKNVEDYYFLIHSNPSIVSLAITKKKDLLEKIQMLLKCATFCKNFFDINDNIEHSYDYVKINLCNINNIEELQEKIEKIRESDFFNNIFARLCNESKNISIEPSFMTVVNRISPYYPRLTYYPNLDIFSMTNEKNIIETDDIYKILNSNVDSNHLNEYHHRVIDNYIEKEIVIDDKFNKRHSKIEIIEEPKKLILVPTKINIKK